MPVLFSIADAPAVPDAQSVVISRAETGSVLCSWESEWVGDWAIEWLRL